MGRPGPDVAVGPCVARRPWSRAAASTAAEGQPRGAGIPTRNVAAAVAMTFGGSSNGTKRLPVATSEDKEIPTGRSSSASSWWSRAQQVAEAKVDRLQGLVVERGEQSLDTFESRPCWRILGFWGFPEQV